MNKREQRTTLTLKNKQRTTLTLKNKQRTTLNGKIEHVLTTYLTRAGPLNDSGGLYLPRRRRLGLHCVVGERFACGARPRLLVPCTPALQPRETCRHATPCHSGSAPSTSAASLCRWAALFTAASDEGRRPSACQQISGEHQLVRRVFFGSISSFLLCS